MKEPASRQARKCPRGALALVAILALARTAAAGSDDYAPHSTAWYGMASFVGLAEGMGFEVTSVSSLEWSDLGPDEILVLVYPQQRVDPTRLGAYVQAGGNVVIADDFGDGKDAMEQLGLLRAEPVTPRASRYYEGHLFAPIATVKAAEHPIASQVGDVVTNHPAALTHIQGATAVIGFDEGAVIVAGERGSGRFVAVADPSIFINRMQQFPGDVQVTANILRWLDRERHARHIILLRGDVPMYGDPRPFIDDAHAGKVGRTVADLNFWLSGARAWLLTPAAMKGLAATLATALLLMALLALPIRRGPKVDGAWLRFGRPARRDEPHRLVATADANANSCQVLACILRDQVQTQLAEVLDTREPLYTLSEAELVAHVREAKGNGAATALAGLYKRLRALPSRGQAAAPWSAGHLPRREFDQLYKDAGELCRTLGRELPEL